MQSRPGMGCLILPSGARPLLGAKEPLVKNLSARAPLGFEPQFFADKRQGWFKGHLLDSEIPMVRHHHPDALSDTPSMPIR